MGRRKIYNPSPEEIEKECAKIREKWTKKLSEEKTTKIWSGEIKAIRRVRFIRTNIRINGETIIY